MNKDEIFECENPCSSVANLLSLGIFGASNRAVVQLGRTLEWGSRGRGFESRRPDVLIHVNILRNNKTGLISKKNFTLQKFFFFRKIGASKK